MDLGGRNITTVKRLCKSVALLVCLAFASSAPGAIVLDFVSNPLVGVAAGVVAGHVGSEYVGLRPIMPVVGSFEI